MNDYYEKIRLLKIEREALAIADDISCILGFAQAYHNQGCLTVSRINDVYKSMKNDPFSTLLNTRFSGNELNGLLENLRTKLKDIRCYDPNQICDYYEQYPNYMDELADEACEEYKRLKLRVSQHLADLYNP